MEKEPRNYNQEVIRQAIDDVVGENLYTPDYDWAIWNRVQELEEQGELPDGVSANEVYDEFVKIFHYED